MDSLSSLVLGSKYPVNFAVANSSSEDRCEFYEAETDLEFILLKIVALGVELRRGRLLREVLLHLRGALQTVHPLSFEYALRRLVTTAEEQFATSQATKLVEKALGALDLDEEQNQFNSDYFGMEGSADGLLRFYWEMLRMVLDIARNNARLESVYHDTALRAFSFCRRFARKNEFRRLCDMIRYHLALAVKYPGQGNAIPLATCSESHKLALELRFNQLTLACDMELWQEAFKTVEDIYGLQVIARKSVRQLTAPEYFDKLARIFAKSDNFMFLAATLLRQPQLDASQESILLAAALAVPIDATQNHEGAQVERMAQIIGLSSVPTRESLLKAIEQRGLWNRPENQIFNQIRDAMQNISVSKGVEALEALLASDSHFSTFVRPCYENLLILQVGKVAKARDSIEISELANLLCVTRIRSSLIPKFNLEMFLLTRARFPGVKIDHMAGVILIDRSIQLASPVAFEGVDPAMTWCHVQTQLRKLQALISRQNFLQESGSLSSLLKAEHEANLERRNLIEKRKEKLEAAAAEKERQEARERALKLQQEAEAERLRQAEEISRRDAERLERERAEIRRLEAEKRLAEQEKMKEAAGARLNREKIASQALRLDYLERALRAEEIGLLEADYVKQKESDLAAYQARSQLILEVARAKHARDLEMKQKFIKSSEFDADYSSFFAAVRERRQREFEERCERAASELQIEKEKRRAKIAAEMEARRRLEAEREASRLSNQEFPPSNVADKYVPPAKSSASMWRREEPASPTISTLTTSTPATNSNSTASNENSSTPEEPRKSVFVPRHKREAAAN